MYTLSAPGNRFEIKVKGSHFISQCHPLADRNDLDRRLQAARDEFSDATHICYAYRLIGSGQDMEEFGSDAGEPNGSAGVPILNALRSADLVNALIWVARYYGGTKLGIAGLIEAYGTAARSSVQSAVRIPWIPMKTMRLRIPYRLVDRVKSAISQAGGQITKEDYATDASITLRIPAGKAAAFVGQVEEWGQGRLKIDHLGD
ncbi:MAG: YigZ family protein [Desulfuromonadales bacterium]|nr:YigZ family protein [Desulfuromonadales bacterium]